MELGLKENLPRGKAQAASRQPGGVVSNLSPEPEVTGLTDETDRSPVGQKNGGGVCPGVVGVWLFIHLYSPRHMYVCGPVTV